MGLSSTRSTSNKNGGDQPAIFHSILEQMRSLEWDIVVGSCRRRGGTDRPRA